MKPAQRTHNIVRALVVLTIIGTCSAWQALTWGASSPSGWVPRKESLVLTYVANTGVLAACGDFKVLIDALFDRPNPEYRAPAQEVLDKIMNGAAPFDGVDLVVVTHNHPDHFDLRLAVRYLEALPEPCSWLPRTQ